MNAKLQRPLGSFLYIVASALLIAPVLSSTAAAQQPLPPIDRFPADAPTRLARAVEGRLHDLGAAWSALELATLSRDALAQPEQRRSLWQSIEGALGSTASAARAPRTAATTLLDVLDDAIGAYMSELGKIALEFDREGVRDAVERLAPLHPGEQGTGAIAVGTIGGFRQLEINFRGQIAHPTGQSPAVVAMFYLLPDHQGPPIPGRLIVPTAGAEPSFRAEIATDTGARETRDYGWRPRLTHQGAILELQINGQWARVEDELDVVPQRRVGRDAPGFCDAACIAGER